MSDFRLEKDTFGEIEVPRNKLWGAQTARSLHHFKISHEKMDAELIRALVLIKKAAADVNETIKALPPEKTRAIRQAADEILSGRHAEEFPLSVWQTGSGTQTNMNVNEVLANLASELIGGQRGEERLLHPNDDVNRSQSSNDVFPTAMSIAAAIVVLRDLIPSVRNLRDSFESKSKEFWHITKVGRTHLMDATPLTLGQEFSGYVSQLDHALTHIEQKLAHLKELALGGTAVGTGLNAPEGFAEKMADTLSLPISSKRSPLTMLLFTRTDPLEAWRSRFSKFPTTFDGWHRGHAVVSEKFSYRRMNPGLLSCLGR